jgi:hypothetical protein
MSSCWPGTAESFRLFGKRCLVNGFVWGELEVVTEKPGHDVEMEMEHGLTACRVIVLTQ